MVRLSRTGLNSTGLELVQSSHQCRCALSRRLRAPQWSQMKTSFLTRYLVSTAGLRICQAVFRHLSYKPVCNVLNILCFRTRGVV